MALIRCLPAIETVKGANEDEKIGVDIVKRAIESPTRELANNAGPLICHSTISIAGRKQSIPFRSLVVGTGDQGWVELCTAHALSQVGQDNASCQQNRLRGTLTLLDDIASKVEPDNFGYFHNGHTTKVCRQKLASIHPYLNRQGPVAAISARIWSPTATLESKMPGHLKVYEIFTCDGEMRLIHGTGTEDCFNGGCMCPLPMDGPVPPIPLSGFPEYGKEGPERDVVIAYRWYLPIPISYEKSIGWRTRTRRSE